ncbi:DUF2252 family protein [Glacieibacterium megasporae]|uniref:DUF2252 family protein n=1 Tax=Glacieibacterium megasporae TaxID=2835787 RepID=UPI0034E282C2
MIDDHKDDRGATLERKRTLKMAESTHAYVRGNTVKFYEWLAESSAAAALPAEPPVWICGDCHLGNLGPLADADGKVDVQIRDLDQTVIGNPTHDLIRLGLSLATAARGADLPGVTTARMIEEIVDGYDSALADPSHHDPAPEPDAVRAVRRRALGRRWRHLAEERLSDIKPTIPLGKKFWALTDAERSGLDALFAEDGVKQMVTTLSGRNDHNDVALVDAAYWMKGCSSLGKLRFAALIAIERHGKPPQMALVDIKEAVAAAAPAAASSTIPADHAIRVVTGARALSPNLGERMLAAKLLGSPVVLRELMPQDLKLEIDQFSRVEATRAARYLGQVVGKAHARQMDRATRREWRSLLGDYRGSGIEAPSWLWRAVVDLVASHEAGYLEHCRRYAMAA